MKNRDVYNNFLSEYVGSLCNSETPWEIDVCRGKPCEGCIHRFVQWLDKDCAIVSNVEHELLLNINPVYIYIGRDAEGDLWLFENEPCLNNGIFDAHGGRVYKLPDFIAVEFDSIKCESFYKIAEI